MEIQIKAGDFDVIQSGTIVYMPHNPITFNIDGLKYAIMLYPDIKSDENGKSLIFKRDKDDECLMNILIYVKDLYRCYSNELYEVGVLHNRKLYFSFYGDLITWTNLEFEAPINFSYTWLLGETIEDNTTNEK